MLLTGFMVWKMTTTVTVIFYICINVSHTAVVIKKLHAAVWIRFILPVIQKDINTCMVPMLRVRLKYCICIQDSAIMETANVNNIIDLTILYCIVETLARFLIWWFGKICKDRQIKHSPIFFMHAYDARHILVSQTPYTHCIIDTIGKYQWTKSDICKH